MRGYFARILDRTGGRAAQPVRTALLAPPARSRSAAEAVVSPPDGGPGREVYPAVTRPLAGPSAEPRTAHEPAVAIGAPTGEAAMARPDRVAPHATTPLVRQMPPLSDALPVGVKADTRGLVPEPGESVPIRTRLAHTRERPAAAQPAPAETRGEAAMVDRATTLERAGTPEATLKPTAAVPPHQAMTPPSAPEIPRIGNIITRTTSSHADSVAVRPVDAGANRVLPRPPAVSAAPRPTPARPKLTIGSIVIEVVETPQQQRSAAVAKSRPPATRPATRPVERASNHHFGLGQV